MPEISVIIPVYNAQDYLERCLDSVCNQTLKDIEIICINDCSTDNSLEILNNYANKYSNLKIIDCEENGGESVARNKGLDIATGEYLAFVDNDDTIDLDFYEKLYKKAKDTNADIVKGNAKIYNYDGKIDYDEINTKVRKYNSCLFFTSYWWTAIYRTTLIKKNDINFINSYPLGGDILFLNKAILKANRLKLVDNIYYNYYRRENSGDSKILSFEKITSALKIHETIMNNILTSNKYEKDEIGTNYVLYWCLGAALNYAYRNKNINNLKYCLKKAFEFYNKIQTSNEISIKENNLEEVQIEYLKQNNFEKLYNLYLNYNTPQKMFLANLKFLHIKKRELKNA